MNASEQYWYPMRITYGREEKVKAHLDQLHIENFLPMRYELILTPQGKKKRTLVPAIPNLLFVHSTQQVLTELKMTRREFEPMRYMTNHLSDHWDERILRVPDAQMENFMRVASRQDDSVLFLQSNEYLHKEGRRVRIIDGDFAGVEGTIKRIKRNKHVVVQLEGIAAVAIAFVPASYLREIDDNR